MPKRLELPGFFKNQNENKPQRKRKLVDMWPFEVALVPKGANRETFTVAKEDSVKINVSSLERAQEFIGQVVTVCKTGEPSPAVSETLQKDLAQAHILLGEIVQPDGKTGKENPSITKAIDLAKKIGGNSNDLNLSDQIAALTKELTDLQASSVLQTPETKPVETKPVEVPPPNVKPTEVKPTETKAEPATVQIEVTKPAVTVETKPTEAATTTEQAPQGTVEVTTSTEDPAPEVTVVTKSDLETFGKGMMEQVVKLLSERTTVNKGFAVPSAGSNDVQVIQTEGKHKDVWGASFDLNDED
jgi:hypothetical protein